MLQIGDACKTAGTGNQAYIQVQSQNVKTDRFCGKILSADNANVSPGEIICKYRRVLSGFVFIIYL